MRRASTVWEVMGANRIMRNLWQGSKPPTGRDLSDDGYKALVLAAEEFQPPGHRFPGVRVRHAPLDDHLEPLTTTEWETIISAANFVVHNVEHGRKTLVTCYAGINRSGIITAMAVCLLTGVTGKQAVAHVRDKRPNALSNKSFAYHIESVMG